MMPPVLFVDDSEVARVAAVRLLSGAGLTVTALASSQEAAGVDPGGFAAALLDIDLGDGLGTDVARVLRAGAPGIPIAFLTASTAAPALDDAKRLGPVFSKADEVTDAVAWIAAAAFARK